MVWDRGAVWKQLGAPTDQVGSVNDPRSLEEYGVRWNEKWIYRDPDGESFDRIVLWYRYDLAGIFKIGRDGGSEPDPLPPSA